MSALCSEVFPLKVLGRLLSILARPHAPKVVIAIALLLALPALFSPLVFDDYLFEIQMDPTLHLPGLPPDPGLFSFVTGDPAQHAVLMEGGGLPWWTTDNLRISFWRPIASATHHLDHALWNRDAFFIHLHSLLWFVLLLFLLSRLYRRFHTPAVATLALALYAFDDARGWPLHMAANRNALIAAVFGVLVLIAHDRWRRDGWKPGVWLGPVFLGAGLLSAELALSTTAFLFAHALFIDDGSLRRRLVRLVPYAAVVIVWQITYSALGHGHEGSGAYIHPLAHPLRFAERLFENGPILALGQLAFPPAETHAFKWARFAVELKLFAWFVIAGFGALIWPLLKRRAEVRFWIVGALLALIPLAAPPPMDRLLVFVGIGASGAIAALLAHAVDRPPGRLAQGAIVVLALIHLVAAPLLLPFAGDGLRNMNRLETRIDESVPSDRSITERSLVVFQAPSSLFVTGLVLRRTLNDQPRPKNIRIISTWDEDTRVTRLDAYTLRVKPSHGFHPTWMGQGERAPWLPFAIGETVTLSDMTVTVTQVTDDGRAAEAEFRFSTPLEDPRWLWTRWSAWRLHPWTPPEVGAEATVPQAE